MIRVLREALDGWKSPHKKDWLKEKTLEKIRGKAISFIRAEPKAKLYIREMTRIITELEQSWGANMPVPLDRDLEREFKVWLQMDQVKMVHVWRPEMLNLEKPSRVSFTDASIFAWGVVYFKADGTRKRYTRYIPEEYIDLPIHLKEIIIIIKMLEKEPEEFTECTLVHYCDNESVAIGYQNLGTGSPELNRWVVKLYEKLHEIRSVMR